MAVARTGRQRNAIDPTSMRLSDHFLLSDFMGCHSAYVKGYPNIFEDEGQAKIREGVCLAEQVLEPIVAESPVSVSYGYISPSLSQNIVKYQDPNKPSYHRWDAGAACDIVVHAMDRENVPPILIARAIDEEFPISRLITYSESSFICVAVRSEEVASGKPRRAFYENRYTGKHKGKPAFCTVPQNREAYFNSHKLPVPWRGQGYPSYHGGGIRQSHHIRTSKYTMLSDFLYSTYALTNGQKNCPTLTEDWVKKFSYGGWIYDKLLDRMSIQRLSIVRAYESPRWNKTDQYTWDKEFEIDFIPPSHVDPVDVAQAAAHISEIHAVSVDTRERRVCIKGFLA